MFNFFKAFLVAICALLIVQLTPINAANSAKYVVTGWSSTSCDKAPFDEPIYFEDETCVTAASLNKQKWVPLSGETANYLAVYIDCQGGSGITLMADEECEIPGPTSTYHCLVPHDDLGPIDQAYFECLTDPTSSPSAAPSSTLSAVPTAAPSWSPTTTPTFSPSSSPSMSPSSSPSISPSLSPSTNPLSSSISPSSITPSLSSSISPSVSSSISPSISSSISPSLSPSTNPLSSSISPSLSPSTSPSLSPSISPSLSPSMSPSSSPSISPSLSPSISPSLSPSTNPLSSSISPSLSSSISPSSISPSISSSISPSLSPSISPSLSPSISPSLSPSMSPSSSPSISPSLSPSTNPLSSSISPSLSSSISPSISSSISPSLSPSISPSLSPSISPSLSPSMSPSSSPSISPSLSPSTNPLSSSISPSLSPSTNPLSSSISPSLSPSKSSSLSPSMSPSSSPSISPSSSPSISPSLSPSKSPSLSPSISPTSSPSSGPTTSPPPSAVPTSSPTPLPENPTAFIFDECAPGYNAEPEASFEDGCYDISGLDGLVSSISFSCSTSSTGIVLFADSNCSGQPFASYPEPVCLDIDLHGSGTWMTRRVECKQKPLQLAQATQEQTCSEEYIAETFDTDCQGIIYPDAYLAVDGYPGNSFLSYSTTCGKLGETGFKFYFQDNCQGEFLPTYKGPVCFGYLSSTTNESISWHSMSCQNIKTHSLQLLYNSSAPGSCRGEGYYVTSVGNDGCINAASFELESFTVNAQPYLSVQVTCESTLETENGFTFFEEANCEGGASELFNYDFCGMGPTADDDIVGITMTCLVTPDPISDPQTPSPTGPPELTSGFIFSSCSPEANEPALMQLPDGCHNMVLSAQGFEIASIRFDCFSPSIDKILLYEDMDCESEPVVIYSGEPICLSIDLDGGQPTNRQVQCRKPELLMSGASPEPDCDNTQFNEPALDFACVPRPFENYILKVDGFPQDEFASFSTSCGEPGDVGVKVYLDDNCQGEYFSFDKGPVCLGFIDSDTQQDVSWYTMSCINGDQGPQQTPMPTIEQAFPIQIHTYTDSDLGVCEGPRNLTRQLTTFGCVRSADSNASSFLLGNDHVKSYFVNCFEQNPFILFEYDSCEGNPLNHLPTFCAVENSSTHGLQTYFAECNYQYYFGEDVRPVGAMRFSNEECDPSNHLNPTSVLAGKCISLDFGGGIVNGNTYFSMLTNCTAENNPGIIFFTDGNCLEGGTAPVSETCLEVSPQEEGPSSFYSIWCWPTGASQPAPEPTMSPGQSCTISITANNTSPQTCNGTDVQAQYEYDRCIESIGAEFDINFGSKVYRSIRVNCNGDVFGGTRGISLFEENSCGGDQSGSYYELCAAVSYGGQALDYSLKCMNHFGNTGQISANFRTDAPCQPTNQSFVSGSLTNACYSKTSAGNDGWVIGGNTYNSIRVDCGVPGQPGTGISFYGDESCSGGLETTPAKTACAEILYPANQTGFVQVWCVYPDHTFFTTSPTTPTKLPTKVTVPTKIPTRQPTTKTPTNQPTKSPTISGIAILMANLTQDLTKIEVRFVSDTNQRNSPQRGPCAPWLTLHSNDTGCGGVACNVTCVWNSPRILWVELNALSNFKIEDLIVTLAENSNVRDAFVLSGSSFGTVPVTVDLPNVVSPSVTISGPSVVSLCNDKPILITSSVSGTGGRAPKYEWLLDDEPLESEHGSRLTVAPPQAESTFVFKVKVTNFANKEFTSTALTVQFSNTAVPQVLISSSSAFSVNANVRVDLGAEVNLPKLCRGSSTTNNYVYQWKIVDVGTEEVQAPTGVSLTSPRLILNPASLLAPSKTYRIELEVNPGVVGVNPGKASVLMTVNPAPIVAIVRSSVASMFATDSLKLDASRSCNPNFPSPQCFPGSGQNQKLLNGLDTFEFYCRDATQEDCSAPCEVDPDAPAECVIPANSLDPTKSPYQFFVRVIWDSLQSNSQPVVVTVFPQREECNLPKIRMLDFPTKINVGETGEAALRTQVEGFDENPAAGRVFAWFDMSTGTASQVQKYVGQGITTRPNLVLQLSTLTPGSTYSFRLVAVQPCAGDANAFGEITFQTNSAPSGGVLTVSPMSGRAGVDEFLLFVDGAVDEDLPLSYSFEYRTDFSAGSIGKFLTLSSFSQSSSLRTRFQQASRILVVARVRDSLNAVTSRSVSPRVDNVVATELVATPEEIPFNAEEELNDLKGSGGSDEDALRVAGALAAAAANDPAMDPQTLDPTVLSWKKETQTKLLDVVVSTEVEDPDPSFVMLQASALSSILSSASSIQDVRTEEGEAFLTKAADFVGNLLQNAQNAILAKGEGENDPLLSQYRPSDLGDVTVSSLMSILDAIKSSSLNARRRLRRRLLRGESLESDEEYRRYLQAEEATKTVVGTVRDQLRALAETLLLGAVSGAAPQVVNGAEMRIVAVSEVPVLIGQDNSLRTISIPAFDASDPPTIFTLPQALLDQYEFGESELVKILAVRFRFNIRELAGGVNLPNLTLDENGPVNNITEMLALDFQRNSTDRSIHPFDLTESIRIQIPLEYSEPDNTTRPSCGYFDTEENVWSSFGCNVTEFSLPVDETDKTGYIICECNHASDYAAWQAFVKDVNSVFNPVDMSNLSTIAALVLGVLLPSISLVWIISQYVGQRWDKRDSDYVHYGAFVALTKRKLELHDRQRRFFRFLRYNTGPIPVDEILRLKQEAEARERQEIDEKTRAEFERVVYRLIVLVFMGSAVSFAMCFTGVFVSNFVSVSTASLAAVQFPDKPAVMGLALTSGAVSLLVAMNVLEALVLRGGKLAKSTYETGRFQVVVASEIVAAVLGVAAFAVGLSATPGTSPGAGLGLVISAGAIAILNAFFAFLAFFIHQHGPNSRKHGAEFIRNVVRSILYEQTLINAFSRFDPFFDRQKRFSIVVAVIVGNLFACSVFFALRQGESVSFGVVLASTMVSSMIVAIPVKIAMRVLFKVARSRSGSKLDRISQIFRMTAFTYDVHPAYTNEAEKLDVEMLSKFRRFYVAKHNFKLLEQTVRQAKRGSKKGGNSNIVVDEDKRQTMLKMFSTNAIGEEEQKKPKSLLKMFSTKLTVGGQEFYTYGFKEPTTRELVVQEQKDSAEPVPPPNAEWTNRQTGEFQNVMTNNAESRFDLMDVREMINKSGTISPEIVALAKFQLHQTKVELKVTLEQTRKAWEKFEKIKWSTITRKQAIVRRERNTFLKLVVSMADEPHPRPRVYEARLPSWSAYIGWLIMFLYYAGCILWICFWIFSRNGQSRDALVAQGIDEPTNEQISAETNAYLLAWLGTSFFGVFLAYFVFEPILVVMRYAILPVCVKTLRPEDPVTVDELKEDEVEEEDEDNEKPASLWVRICCCGYCRSMKAMKNLEKNIGEAVITVIEALV